MQTTGPLTGGLTRQFLTGPKKVGGPQRGPTQNFEGAQRSAECKNRKKKNKEKIKKEKNKDEIIKTKERDKREAKKEMHDYLFFIIFPINFHL